ncbi:hypothetical protein RhiirC2_798737 [Rhizophagus irregularis]|uniref:Uncharacterized protein n=1 Tax=Rhizophagus irregularis TaxID=588596 RepID=A0A2N1M603_9GLOM|nr:hypothetical protein RhiirC2_798737 [Rhizophagus irregularis]
MVSTSMIIRWPETDEEKVQKEIAKNVRPKNKDESDKHVIHVYDKPWRSGKKP